MALLQAVEGVPEWEKIFDASEGKPEDRTKLVTAKDYLPAQLKAKEEAEKAKDEEIALLKAQLAALQKAQATGAAQPLELSADEEKDLSSFSKSKRK